MRNWRSLLFCMIFAFSPACVFGEVQPLRVGVLTSLSGNWAAMGDMTRKGLELAKEQLSSEVDGLYDIKLDIQDSHEVSSGFGAVTAYNALRNKGIDLFIGPAGTPGGLALVPKLRIDPVLIISPSVAVESFHLAGKNIFNSQGAFEIASRLLANQAYKEGLRKMAIFSSQHPYESAQADAFEHEFKRLGGEIIVRVDPLPENNDLRTEALKIARMHPDGVFFAVYNKLAMAAKDLKLVGFDKAKFAPIMDNSRFEGADGALDGLTFTQLGGTEEAFVNKFKEKFGMAPDYPAEYAYDGLMALVKAVLAAKSTIPAKVITELSAVEFIGAGGHFKFDSEGCVVRNPTLWRVKDTEFEKM